MSKVEELIESVLLSLGAKREDLDSVIETIDQVITAKIAQSYSSRFSEEVKNKLKNMADEDQMKYIKNNKDKLPSPLSQEEVEKIVKEVWEDYLKTMSKKI